MHPETDADNPKNEHTVADPNTVDGQQSPVEPPAAVDVTLPVDGGDASAQPAPTPLRRVGNYELLEVIARGGMGVVYRARQVQLNRIVAVKMILAGQFARPDDLQRFRAEAEAAANLNHPNIVRVYETGEHEGEQYFSMEYIEGESLASRVASGPLPPEEAASIVATIAGAIAYAHSQGVIHRDIKPGNVLLDSASYPLAAGSTVGADESSPHEDAARAAPRHAAPRVTDFGLAKKIDDGRGLTMTGQALGTPAYMPPEQAAGHLDKIGPASDIYSLGAVLYCLLTGRPPFQADTPLDTMLQVIDQEPAPPRLLNPKIPPDLETIALKCLEKEPARRYESATELASDLRRFEQGESINARGYNILERIASTVTRSRDDVKFQNYGNMFLAFAALTLVTDSIVTAILWWEAPYLVLAAIQYGRLAAFGLICWWMRPATLFPTTAAGRQLWAICGGFIITATVYGGSDRVLHRTMYTSVEAGIYPGLTAISGFAFFAMAPSYWGGCYVIAVAFFIASLLMPLVLDIGPLIFGIMWAGSMTIMGLRMKAFARQQQK